MFFKYSKLSDMEPLTLSGNKGIIRLKTGVCPTWSTNCDTGRGFKIKVGVGKYKTVVWLIYTVKKLLANWQVTLF